MNSASAHRSSHGDPGAESVKPCQFGSIILLWTNSSKIVLKIAVTRAAISLPLVTYIMVYLALSVTVIIAMTSEAS